MMINQKVIDSPPYIDMISPQNKLSQTSKVEKGDLKMVGTIQIVHHDGVTSEVDRFSSEPAKKAIGRTRTLDLDANDRQRAPRSNDGKKSLSQSNLGD